MQAMKKRLLGMIALLLAAGMLYACSPQEASSTAQPAANQTEEAEPAEAPEEPGTRELEGEIEIVTNLADPAFSAMKSIFDGFMEENPGVSIEFSTQESDYEQLMKARMASNDLPDIFATHGWSVARYSEYLRPLNDQPWVDGIDSTLIPVISNDGGEIFVLPINMDCGGLMYNKGLLAELGADIPTTWDEFMEICELGKQNGYVGLFIPGKDTREPANVLDLAATTMLDNRDEGYTTQLLDGTFDWQDWAPLSQFLVDLTEKGYLNVDRNTCDPVDLPERLAENDTLFHITTATVRIEQVSEVNPEVEFGFAPLPAWSDEYEPAFCGGEREAYGVWKDTENAEVCLAVLEYLAKPENIRLVCEASSRRPAHSGVQAELGSVMADFTYYADVPVLSVFDRVYLPSGMWSTLRTIGSALISDEMSVEESIQVMEEDYYTLLAQVEE